jgi:ribosomal protein S18 acetylase RimI-like enzyme
MPSIRPLTVYDVRSVRDIFFEIFDECEDSRYAHAWRNRSTEYSLGYFIDGHLIGFTLVEKIQHGYYLNYIAVHDEYQGRNIGSELLSALLKRLHAKRLSLSLIPVDNEKTIQWYKDRGFYITSEWKTRDGIKALYMMRHFYNTRSCPSL